ncbi:MAG: hypothetical protein HZB20_09140, partial [Chloroflexi bacterium]|nr:hypothetical protein [Chloroflexota bacterium]
ALAPGASHELWWEVYPTTRADYYDFINAARRSLRANYRIDGSVVIAHGYEGNAKKLSDDDLRRLVHCNNARYVVLSDISRLDEKGERLPERGIWGMAHGTGFLGEHGRWTRHWLEKTIERFRRVAPHVKLLPYIDPFVCSEPDAHGKYADSVATQADGLPQLYTDHKLSVFYPTRDNSYGRALEQFFDYLLEHADGFYMDESSMYINPVGGVFSARPDTWDGHSCQMDRGQGPDEKGATYRVVRRLTSSALYTLPFRLRQLEKARKMGKSVWMNFEPVAEEEAALQSYRFVETRSNNSPIYGHLGCPVALGNDYTERREQDIGRTLWTRLLSAGLLVPYGKKYQTDHTILQDTYPFEPVELRCGYIIGKEKIITRASGAYSFGDDSPLSVRIYDAGGFHLPQRNFRVEPAGAKTQAKVKLAEGELAIIFR